MVPIRYNTPCNGVHYSVKYIVAIIFTSQHSFLRALYYLAVDFGVLIRCALSSFRTLQ